MNQPAMTETNQPNLQDEEFIEQFENCTLPGECFHHQDHVRLAWLYLCRHTLMDALVKFSEGLKRFALSKGKAGLYHETITLAYLFLIHERLKRCGAQQNWQEFADANADLLDWQNNVLKKLYREETLFSEFARKVFVFPDKSVNAVESAANSEMASLL
jgi:hypothetical protein